ncbi:hypothetical protein LSTR_LSTR010774 [Laodelphax striatellus]|uniref:Uncharacterized protein n=1 Tax=Laodelphax striatellus TaxID=195883 RepID=A0A482XDC7_LAOST|nr:hypothetical protein LSTR_LSTR010774 [Laodelphax striatellus]
MMRTQNITGQPAEVALSVVDKGELIFSTDVDEWQRNRDSILQAFEIELRNQDLERYNGSASILFRVPRGIADGDAGYFSLHWLFAVSGSCSAAACYQAAGQYHYQEEYSQTEGGSVMCHL